MRLGQERPKEYEIIVKPLEAGALRLVEGEKTTEADYEAACRIHSAILRAAACLEVVMPGIVREAGIKAAGRRAQDEKERTEKARQEEEKLRHCREAVSEALSGKYYGSGASTIFTGRGAPIPDFWAPGMK